VRHWARAHVYLQTVADTSYLRREVEKYVRHQLQAEFGQRFTAQYLPLVSGGQHEFDAVSEDRAVVVSVKAASGLTAGRRIPSGKIKDSLAELYYLSLVTAPTRQLVLTTPSFFDIFTRYTGGAIAPGLEVRCMPLPHDIQLEVDAVVAAASREVSPGRATAAIAADIEADADAPTGGSSDAAEST
jgi:hypothetical protein